MKKWLIIFGIITTLAVLGLVVFPRIADQVKKNGPPPLSSGPVCLAQAGEWMPEKGECPGSSAETRAKCEEFCRKHPDCCGEKEQNDQPFGGQEVILPLPSAEQVANLKRDYPKTIKALNGGPNIYTRGLEQKIISGKDLEETKAIGFNTIQVLLIGKKENGKLVFNEANNAALLNDIIAIKNHGLAVWVALDIAGVPTGGQAGLGDYNDFKTSFLDFTKKSAELMEEYKVEYFTPNNEPDKPFHEQNWSAEEENDNLADFLLAANAAAREKFNGKLINKITRAEKHTQKVIDASLSDVDIAGIDVGPPMDEHTTLSFYKEAFKEYQYYASLAEKAGVPWMNAEYWQGDFDNGYTDFAKDNELEYAKISFDAYLKTIPRGVGYVWNDFATFSLPQGEQTKKALADFLDKL